MCGGSKIDRSGDSRSAGSLVVVAVEVTGGSKIDRSGDSRGTGGLLTAAVAAGGSKIERSGDIFNAGVGAFNAKVFATPTFTHTSSNAAAGVFTMLFG